MIQFNKIRLDNGLRLIHHYDSATKMVALNLLYNVGSKHEDPNKTGLAHFMEHLMFSGSKNVPGFDDVLQAAGGSSNAWTNVDMTNYYETLPVHNIETALWAESDRLVDLTLSDTSINIQRDVVIEEFKQRYLNEPYGDLSHAMHDLAYVKHPYKWPTIGKCVEHISDVSREDIMSFYKRFYSVDNLIMCVSGNISFDDTVRLVEKYFGDITPSGIHFPKITVEPRQCEQRIMNMSGNVPQNLICRVYHMPGRCGKDYPACDLLSDVLSNGKSSRFYQNILSKSGVFADLDAAIEGTNEPGLFLIRGRLVDGVSFEQADEIIDKLLSALLQEGVTQYELDKCLNKFHAAMLFDNISYQEKATKLCEYELLGDAQLFNNEVDRYRLTTTDSLVETARRLFDTSNCSRIYYSKKD